MSVERDLEIVCPRCKTQTTDRITPRHEAYGRIKSNGMYYYNATHNCRECCIDILVILNWKTND